MYVQCTIQQCRNLSIHTFDIIILDWFQLLSLGILEEGANSTITAAVTFTTAGGGLPNDFNSVRLPLLRVFKASDAAFSAGSAFARSRSQSVCFLPTSRAILATFFSSLSAIAFSLLTFSVSMPTLSMRASASSFFCLSSTWGVWNYVNSAAKLVGKGDLSPLEQQAFP